MLPAVVGRSKAGMAVGFAGALKPAGKSAARLPAHATTRASAARRVHDPAMTDTNDIVTSSNAGSSAYTVRILHFFRRQEPLSSGDSDGCDERNAKSGANLRESAFVEQSPPQGKRIMRSPRVWMALVTIARNVGNGSDAAILSGEFR